MDRLIAQGMVILLDRERNTIQAETGPEIEHYFRGIDFDPSYDREVYYQDLEKHNQEKEQKLAAITKLIYELKKGE